MMPQHGFPRLGLLAMGLIATVLAAALEAAPQVWEVVPGSGVPGTVVAISGSGFGTDLEAVAVTVGGTPAVVLGVTDTELQVQVPGTSGAVEVEVGGERGSALLPFVAQRVVAVNFIPPAGFEATGYRVGTLLQATLGMTGTASVAHDGVEMVWAWRGAEDPMFGAVVLPGNQAMTVDAASTALAWVAISPLAPRGDPAALADALARVSGTAENAALASLIAEASAAGYAYVEDGRFGDLLVAVLQRALDGPGEPGGAPFAASTFVPPGRGYLRHLVPDYSLAQRRLQYALSPFSADPPIQRLTASPDGDHPTRLHQNLEIWRVDPGWFTGGFEGFDRTAHSDRPWLLDDEPYVSGFVSATLGSEKLDPVDWLGKAVSAVLDSVTGQAATDDQFLLPRDRPGIYLVNAFSGNVWYGSVAVDPLRSQSALISQIDPNSQWRAALATNIVIAAVDLTSIVLPTIKVLGREAFGEIVKSIGVEVSKSLAGVVSAYGDVDSNSAVQLTKTATVAVAKAAGGKLAEVAADNGLAGFLGASLRIMGESVNALGKLSAGLQAVERGAALILPTHDAVERALVAIGDPYAPQIRAFQPAVGRAGEILQVYGEFLPTNTAEIRFSFVTFAATGNPPPLNARLDATIVSSSSGVYQVRLPPAADWQTAFGSGDLQVYLALRHEGTSGETTTQGNPAPFHQFTYRAPPQIVSIEPNPVRPGEVLEITVTGNDPVHQRDLRLEVDALGYGRSFTMTPERVYVTIDNSLEPGDHVLRLFYAGTGSSTIFGASNSVPFTVADPYPLPQWWESRGLTVTRISMENVADGELSLYEALALASGTLGRNLTVRPEGVSEGRYESDWVEGNDFSGGADIRDIISISNSASGGPVVAVNAPLPPLGKGDILTLGSIVLDGSGAPPGTIGLDLRGVEGVRLTGGTFRNFPAEGILLGNGTRFNRIDNVVIESPGASGIVFAGDARDNAFYSPVIRDAGEAGVWLAGSGVVRNRILSSSTPPLFGGERALFRIVGTVGHGLVVEGGARANFLDVGEIRAAGEDGIHVAGGGTSGNQFGSNFLPGFRDVAGATGHGVHVLDGASDNLFTNLSVSGSGGDGFRLIGPLATRNQVRNSATSFDFGAMDSDAFRAPNGGHSLVLQDTAWNTIGARGVDLGLNSSLNHFGGSLGGATVLITGAGSHHNVVDCSAFGFMEPSALPDGTPPERLLIPATGHALHVTGGASYNVLGASLRVAASTYLAVPHGAAIRIDGVGTNHNHVLGSTFGIHRNDLPEPGQEVRVGIEVRDGAASNRIGQLGNAVGGQFQPFNVFGTILEAAVRLEAVTALHDAAGVPLNPNEVVNNRFGVTGFGTPSRQPEVAIHLRGQVTGQIIGGSTRAHGNQASRFGFAGLWIEGGVIPEYSRRNRITGTWTSTAVGSSGTVPNSNPFAGPTSSHALLISGGAQGQVVGEEWPLYNQFSGGNVTAYLDGGNGHWLRGSWFDAGVRATIFARDGSHHRIGGSQSAHRVRVTRGGTVGDDDTAGIVLAGGGQHRVQRALIGDIGTVDLIWGPRRHGILIDNSAGNRVGGPSRAEGNTIVRAGGDGIHVRGAGSTGNEIGSNRIGFGTRLSANPGNAGAGVQFSAGASGNRVGGLQAPWGQPGGPGLPAPNEIRGNLGDGIRVTGTTTVGNRFLSNSISGNAGLGIRHVDGGNRHQPPPAVLTLAEGEVRGTVGSLTATPAGSLIEVFINPFAATPQGESLLGRGRVEADGSFRFPYPMLPPGGVMTATATHAVTGDTSEFTAAIALPPEFGLHLATPLGEGLQQRPWPGGAAFAAVVLAAQAVESEVEVETLRVQAEGTGEFAAALAGVSLFEDVDGDGVWSAADRQLAPLAAFAGDPLIAELHLAGAHLEHNRERRWILQVHATGAPDGSVQLSIPDATAVGERYWQPLGSSGVAATFPLRSATYVAGAPPVDGRAEWRTSFGLAADGSGAGADDADPDGDGLVNLLEYALGSSPVAATDSARPQLGRLAGPDRVTLSYRRLRAELDYTVEAAPAPGGPWTTAGVDPGNPTDDPVVASIPLTGTHAFVRLKVTAR